MPRCSHGTLLQVLQDDDAWSLEYTHRLRNLLGELENSTQKHPSLVCFLGGKKKNDALQVMRRPARRPLVHRGGLVNLDIDMLTADNQSPMLIADGTLSPALNPRLAYLSCNKFKYCGKVSRNGINWLDGEADQEDACQRLVDSVYARVVLPFTDVLCIFLDDMDDELIIKSLDHWQEYKSTDLMTAPRLLLVTNCAGRAIRWRKRAADRRKGDSNLGWFQQVMVLKVHASNHLSNYTRYMSIRRRVLSESREARTTRIQRRLLFNTVDFVTLFEASLHALTSSRRNCFDPVLALRADDEPAGDFTPHIKAFAQLAARESWSDHATASFVASALILDAFPPGMHHFDATSSFRTLYTKACRDAIPCTERSVNWCDTVQEFYSDLAYRLYSQTATSATLREESISQLDCDWAKFRTHTTCLICLRRPPEHKLSCGHTICDTCVKIYGMPIPWREYRFELKECKLCRLLVSQTVKLVPSTASLRCLSFDGGGVAGIVGLVALMKLEIELGLPWPIQNEFDLAIGTSIGGIGVLLLIIKQWSVRYCIDAFSDLVKRAFASPCVSRERLLPRIASVIAWVIRDAKYSSHAFEECLYEIFGDRGMFHTPEIGESGMKVGVTAQRVKDASLCIISNYNGIGSRPQGHSHLRSENPTDDISVCTAARATTAAVSYFRPVNTTSAGFLEDPGIGRNNNPAHVTSCEAQAICGRTPDLSVSIGTGRKKDVSDEDPNAGLDPIWDSFVGRILRVVLTGNNCHREYQQHKYSPGDETAYKFRLDIELTKHYALDDVESIETLNDIAHSAFDSVQFNNTFSALGKAFTAASFFFELAAKPELCRNGQYYCRGFIRSRSEQPRTRIRNVLKKSPGAGFQLASGESLGRLSLRDTCLKCGYFRKAVSFPATESVPTIMLRFDEEYQCKISGFPVSRKTIETQQEFHRVSSRTDHMDNAKWSVRDCGCSTKELLQQDKSTTRATCGKRPNAGAEYLVPKRPRPTTDAC